MTGETKVIIGLICTTVAILVGGVLYAGSTAHKEAAPVLPQEQIHLLSREGDNKIVAENAKVTLTEFADFECEACGAMHPIVKQILDEYKGRITFVHRYFPLDGHRNGRLAAQSVAAAGKQGKFWEMYNKMFEKQKEWGEQETPQREKFIGYAKEVGLDIDTFTKDLDNKEIADRIQKDIDDGHELGVAATPTFFINDERMEGGLPFEEFKKKLDEKLK